MSWLPLFDSLTVFILAFLLWPSPVLSHWLLCPTPAGCPAFRWRQLAATAGEGEAWSVPHAPFYPSRLSEPFAGDDWSGCLETSHGKEASWARLHFSPCCRSGRAAKLAWWFSGIPPEKRRSGVGWSLWAGISYHLFWVMRTDAFVVFCVASWFPLVCNTGYLGEIPHTYSQNTGPFTRFGVHPSCLIFQSDTAGVWCKCLKVTGVRTGIWSFAIKQRVIFVHFWCKCWLLTSRHISCIVVYLEFALDYPLAAFRASVCQSALSSCALWSWALLVPQCWAPGVQHWVCI